MLAYHVVNLLLHIIFMSLFLTVFYFTYVTQLERKIIQNQMNFLVESLTDDFAVLTDEQRNALKDILTSIDVPQSIKDEDEKTRKRNSELRRNGIVAAVTFAAVLLIIVAILILIYKISFIQLVRDNLIAVAAIGVVEFAFLHLVAYNYISLDPNFIKREIISNLIALHN